jgi:hypothetical protein
VRNDYDDCDPYFLKKKKRKKNADRHAAVAWLKELSSLVAGRGGSEDRGKAKDGDK